MTALVIRGGHLIDPAAGVDALKDILLKDGRVAEIAAPGKLKLANGAEVLDATGLIVAPGLVDIHVHLREPGQGYKETIATGTAAAAAGGFTSVAAMPNTTPVNDSPEITRWMQAPERGAQRARLPHRRRYPRLQGRGASTTMPRSNPPAPWPSPTMAMPILKDGVMREALAAAARVGLSVIQHAEDTRMTQGASMNLGPMSFKLGLRGMPPEAESSIVERDIRLVTELREARAHLHVAHTSTAAAHGRRAPGPPQRTARHLRGCAASLPAHRGACGLLQHSRQDVSAAALGRRPRRHDRGHPRRRGRRHRHRPRAPRHPRKGSRV